MTAIWRETSASSTAVSDERVIPRGAETVERRADPKGDRVQIAMTGEFLPFKYYGATGNALAYGLKEE